MKEDKTIITKIEIDENNKPSLVSMPSSKVDLPETDYAEISEKLNEENSVSELSPTIDLKKEQRQFRKELGRQMFMSQVVKLETDKTIDKRKRILKNIFSILFVIIAVGVLVYTALNDIFGRKEEFSWETILQTISNNAIYIVYALIALFFCFALKGLNFSITSKALTKRFRFKTCFETAIVEHYYNNVTPLAMGGQSFAIFHLTKHGYDGGTASSMTISTFFMHQLGFVVVGIFSLLSLSPTFNLFNIQPNAYDSFGLELIKSAAFLGLFFCMIMPVLVILFAIFPRVCAGLVGVILRLGEKLKLVKNAKVTTHKTLKGVVKNSKCLKKLGTNPLVFLSAFIVSVLEQFANGAVAFFILSFFGYTWTQDPFIAYIGIVQVCVLVSSAVSFIPTPGNTGAADLTFYEIFKSGLARGLAFPAMFLWRIFSYYSFLLVGFIFVILKRKSDRKKEARGLKLD